MSMQCRYFVQHAWKQNLCANCFESREEHERALKERLQMCIVSKISSDKANNDQNLQGIMRRNRNDSQLSSDSQRKNVAFLDSLTEIIGYGGDDNYDEGSDTEEYLNSSDNEDKINILEEYVPDSEEDRALSNLTRENTNFNKIMQNLTDSPLPETSKPINNNLNDSSSKNFSNLMLGNIQKDNSGKKTTLIVSVTPFQSDSSIRTEHIVAKRHDRIIKKDLKLSDIKNDSKSLQRPLLSSVKQSSEVKCENVNGKILNLSKNNNNTNLSSDKQSNRDKSRMLCEKKASDENCNIHDVIFYEKPSIEVNDEKNIAELKLQDENKPSINDELMLDIVSNDNCDEKSNKIEMEESVTFRAVSLSNNDDNNDSAVAAMPRSSFLHGKINSNHESSDDITKLSEESMNNIDINSSINKSSNESVSNADKQKDIISECQVNDEKVPKLSESSTSSQESSLYSVYTRKPVSNIKSDCPVVREKEKRERNSLCNQKCLKLDDESLSQDSNNMNEKADSLRSQEFNSLSDTECSLAYYSTDAHSDTDSNVRVNKKKSKTQYFLKKFLRIGASRREINIASHTFNKESDNQPTSSSSSSSSSSPSSSSYVKPRLKISHPHKLDGTSVQVLRHKKLINDSNELLRFSNAKSLNHTDNFHSQTLTARLKDPLSNNLQLPESNCLKSLENNSSTLLPSYNNDQSDSELSNILKDNDNTSWRSLTSGLKMKSFTNDSVFVDSGKFRSIQCN